MNNNSTKIIAGDLRNRKINFLNHQKGLRPTSHRIRETLFNWLQYDIYQSTCLDLFAGTGALGIEAISRGAKTVSLIEINPIVFKNIKDNINQLAIKDKAVLYHLSHEQYLKKYHHYFDIIFLDPPFNQDLLQKTVLEVIQLAPKYIYLEDNNPLDQYDQIHTDFKLIRHKKAGQVFYGLLKNNQPRMMNG